MSAVGGYGLVVAVLLIGWVERNRNLLAAEYGLGYALGIAGASLMGLLLLYPLRKRVRALHRLGRVSAWFRMHMVFGVVGPALILFHCNFSLGSFNSRVALFCTLIVAVSGLFGRYFYSRIHHGLYGRRASLQEMTDSFRRIQQQHTPMARFAPSLFADLERFEVGSSKPRGVCASLWLAIVAGVTTRIAGVRLRRRLRPVMDELVASSPVIAAERKRFERNWNRYVTRRLRLLREVAQFTLFERLFSLWHVTHFPLFLVMVIAVTIHIVAVHMY